MRCGPDNKQNPRPLHPYLPGQQVPVGMGAGHSDYGKSVGHHTHDGVFGVPLPCPYEVHRSES